jgi:hypothetical protein
LGYEFDALSNDFNDVTHNPFQRTNTLPQIIA